jgi:transposase InsO family protein
MASKARLVISAVVLEGRSPSEVARSYGVARSWVYELVARCRREGDVAFEPRSRRPKTSPLAIDDETVALILELRHWLSGQGLDAGAETIRWHLEHRHEIRVHAATIYRTLRRHELILPAPQKRPRSSYIRFEAELPNECWQSDFMHYPLADGTDSEILSWLDDHSRYALRLSAHQPVTGPIVRDEFRTAVAEHGAPASTLTDNGMVYTVRFAGGRGGRNAFEAELHHLGIVQKNSRPNHPTTCGKIERFQQTLRRWLDQQPTSSTLDQLQALLDTFRPTYNDMRPHRALPQRATPATIYNARPKASPTGRDDPHVRVRRDQIDTTGVVTLRVDGRLHHIGIGRTHARTHVILLVNDLHIRVVDAATGELLRDLTIDTNRDYQPTGAPKGPIRPNKKRPEPH